MARKPPYRTKARKPRSLGSRRKRTSRVRRSRNPHENDLPEEIQVADQDRPELGPVNVVALVHVIHSAVILMESLNCVFEPVEAFPANVDYGREQEQHPLVIIREPSHALESWQAIAESARLFQCGRFGWRISPRWRILQVILLKHGSPAAAPVKCFPATSLWRFGWHRQL
jgi:hypothetical protein